MITSAMERQNAREGRWEEPQEVEAYVVKENMVKKNISKDQYNQTMFYNDNAIKLEISNKMINEITLYLKNLKHF